MTSKKTPKPQPPAPRSARYRVLTDRLTYPPPEIVRRIEAGEHVPAEERTMIRPGAGAIVDTVPAQSVDWLLEAGAIEEIE